MAFRNPSLSNYYSTFQKKINDDRFFLWQISTPILYRMDLYMILSDQMIFVQRNNVCLLVFIQCFFYMRK